MSSVKSAHTLIAINKYQLLCPHKELDPVYFLSHKNDERNIDYMMDLDKRYSDAMGVKSLTSKKITSFFMGTHLYTSKDIKHSLLSYLKKLPIEETDEESDTRWSTILDSEYMGPNSDTLGLRKYKAAWKDFLDA
ncbi:hypothetical protein A3Q56_06455 [Intoshia linei]|uniref:Uncharacterized protein n=1 Tax=Intoshia linei TaxID=1819745 RepID=A0A177AUZ8_9BILA|nr:hypothetical protein A3Q56_06455 [Intoshia linei]